MAFSTSVRALSSLFPVRARQEGGYDRFQMPDPNNRADLYGNMANPSGDPSHVAGGMSAQEYNSMMGANARARTEALRRDSREQGGLAKVVQGLKTVASDKNWDAFFGSLQQQGVDRLQSGAAAGMDTGPSTYDMKTGASYVSARPGFFDTGADAMTEAADPRTAKAGASSEAFKEHQGRIGNANQMAMSGLLHAPYEPHAPVYKRFGGVVRRERANYLDQQDRRRR